MTDGDNRMAFPDAPERQSTAVRKLLTHEPQTASEIAACFQGGERNVRAVIEVLEAEQAQGRAALVDWGWTFAEPDIERHRPLRTMQYWQIDAISAHYEKHSKLDKDMKDSDWRELISLLVELGLRKGTRAKRLRQRIADRLAISGAVPRLAPGLLKWCGPRRRHCQTISVPKRKPGYSRAHAWGQISYRYRIQRTKNHEHAGAYGARGSQ